jgi:hypothetical protein
MNQLFTGVKSIPTVDVVRGFFPRLELKRDGSGREKALCPFHAEDTPSFTVFEDGWKCFGCGAHGSNVDLLLKADLASSPLEAARMIAEKFGIEVEGRKTKEKAITLSEYSAYVSIPQDVLIKTFRLRETAKGLEMPYLDESGEEVATRIRTKLKAKEGSRWPKGTTLSLYGLWKLEKFKQARTIFLVEGESDIQVCWFNKIPALGVPGAQNFKKEWASLLLSFSRIAIIQEPGEAGNDFVKRIVSALKTANYQGEVKAVYLTEKDPRDLWLKCPSTFIAEMEKAVAGAEVIDLYPPVPLTADLIRRVKDLLRRHIFFKDERLPLLIATWVLGSYVYDPFTFFGYLWINSPVKRCGKSLLEEILSKLCCQATGRLTNMTEAVLFRLAHTGRTLILDEIENLKASDKDKYGAIMSVLNGGFQAGSTVPRNDKSEGGFKIVEFNVYGPKVLAGISSLVDTIEDRSFKVSMVRKTKEEKVERFNLRKQGKEFEGLRRELGLWAEERKKAIEVLYDGIEEIPEMASLDDRFKDVSEPLVAIASYADAEAINGQGKILPDLMSLLLDMAGKRGESEKREAIGAFVILAEEILGLSESVFMPTTDLLKQTAEVEELSWLDSTRTLGKFLARFDLTSTKRRGQDGKQARGFVLTRQWVEEAKNRYSVVSPDLQTSQTSLTRSGSGSEGIFANVPGNPEGHHEK